MDSRVESELALSDSSRVRVQDFENSTRSHVCPRLRFTVTPTPAHPILMIDVAIRRKNHGVLRLPNNCGRSRIFLLRSHDRHDWSRQYHLVGTELTSLLQVQRVIETSTPDDLVIDAVVECFTVFISTEHPRQYLPPLNCPLFHPSIAASFEDTGS